MDPLPLPFFWPRSCDPHRCAREAAGTFTCVFGSQVGKAAGEQRSRGCSCRRWGGPVTPSAPTVHPWWDSGEGRSDSGCGQRLHTETGHLHGEGAVFGLDSHQVGRALNWHVARWDGTSPAGRTERGKEMRQVSSQGRGGNLRELHLLNHARTTQRDSTPALTGPHDSSMKSIQRTGVQSPAVSPVHTEREGRALPTGPLSCNTLPSGDGQGWRS